MHLMPALDVGASQRPVLDAGCPGPAGRVGRHLFGRCFSQAVPQMPPVRDLLHGRVGIADGLGVGVRPVAAHDLDAGMAT
ncbi:hypothetical protein BA062_26405 [Prauserella flavalba]|uniref:Uncharacterized protein n=1 Tax=Prauserella flavalba TaxID=1477506 RepID=A0A318LFJ7_9PSEU|nr:hypothetical protein BA062_26405 [Prauserella flavalba]